jgi:hypothetical protein
MDERILMSHGLTDSSAKTRKSDMRRCKLWKPKAVNQEMERTRIVAYAEQLTPQAAEKPM